MKEWEQAVTSLTSKYEYLEALKLILEIYRGNLLAFSNISSQKEIRKNKMSKKICECAESFLEKQKYLDK